MAVSRRVEISSDENASPQGGQPERRREYPPAQERGDTRRSTAVDGMGLEELFDLLAAGRQEEYEEPIPRERRRRKKRRAKR